MIDYRLFGIKPSNIVSTYCYSVFRLEPYSGCSYNCIYCYGRWYRVGQPPASTGLLLKYWEKIAGKLSRVDAPKPYFRLATLTEPFQEGVEDKYMVSYKMIELAHQYHIPLVINTKSVLVTKSPWIDLLIKMSEEKLVLIQVSLSFISDDVALTLEPRAPSPTRRLEVIDKLREHGIPVVLRLQPLIPGFEDEHLSVLREASKSVQGVIVESLRATREDLRVLNGLVRERLGRDLLSVGWVKYTSEAENLYTPSRNWKRKMYEEIKRFSRDLPLTTCKDYPLSMMSDCCLFWLTGNRSYGVRETIREKILGVKPKNVGIIREYSVYPNPVRKIFRLHNNKLLRIIASGKYLEFLD